MLRRSASRASRILSALSLGGLCLALGATAHAQSPSEITVARQTAKEGLAAYQAGDFDKAIRLFSEAKAVYPSAQILRMWGYSLLARERWEEAEDALQAALESKTGPLPEKDVDDVKQQIGKAEVHLGHLDLKSRVGGAEASLDGKPAVRLPLMAPMRLVEGKHHVEVHADGRTDAASDVTIVGGKTIAITLDPVAKDVVRPVVAALPPPPEPAEKQGSGLFPHQRAIGLAVAGTGVLAGGAALTLALASAHLRKNVESDIALHQAAYPGGCTGSNYTLCSYDTLVINHDADRADSLRDMSRWVGIGAGALGAIGVTLFALSPREESKPGSASARAACTVAASSVSCAGSF